MARTRVHSITLFFLLLAGCTGSGREYWLYPEPRLVPEEEAVFVAYERHRVISIDGEEAASRCWGQTVNEPQPYRRNDQLCRLHLRPGQHTVIFEGRYTMGERNRVEFTAEAGKTYGLDWSDCITPARGHRQTCRVNVMEVKESVGGDT